MKNDFLVTTHLSDMLEKSYETPVIVFKYSNECGTSSKLKQELEEVMDDKSFVYPIFLVTVQIHRSLSQKIEEMFEIKHESPQVIILNKGKVTFTVHHKDIKIDKFKYSE